MKKRAYYHLPGLFEFYELYRVFLPLFREHREYFYDWCEIGSIYGAPSDCIWGGGRTSFGEADAEKVLDLMQEYQISARLTFSNSLLREEHLQDRKCNELCALLEKNNKPQNGVIIHSDLLLDYLQKNYPGLYLISSTTKVLTNFSDFCVSTVRARVSLRMLSACVSVFTASAASSAGSSISGFCDFIILISPKSSSGSASASSSRQSAGSRMTREKIKSLVKGRKSGSGFISTAGVVLVSYFSCIENPF